jgi:hypothetical protein
MDYSEDPDSVWLGKGCLFAACLFVVGALISCCGGYFALRSWAISQVGKPDPARINATNLAAVASLDDLCMGQEENAYARASVGYRKRVSLEQFRVCLRRYTTLGGPYNPAQLAKTLGGARFDDPRQIVMIWDVDTGRCVLSVALVEKVSGWRVDDFTSPDADGGPKNSIWILQEGRKDEN